MASNLALEARSYLLESATVLSKRFSKLFDEELFRGVERIIANAAPLFLSNCPTPHLRSILLTQYFLQKNIEKALKKEKNGKKHLYLKLFPSSSHICISLSCSSPSNLSSEEILKTLQALLPGIDQIPHSSYSWSHPEMPYHFCYLEVQKLRGRDLLPHELKEIETVLRDQLIAIPPQSPALFWPYNPEESYRQMQLLQREIVDKNDLPHISLQFREQTPTTIEFVVHLAQPMPIKPLTERLQEFSDSLDLFVHLHQISNKNSFPVELSIFSVKIDASAFNVKHSVNLLYARRNVLKYLEAVLGPLRDFNGGLFEKLQDLFEKVRSELYRKIPLFDLFAEELFYAIYPIEARLSLKIEEFEQLFSLFSKLMRDQEPFIFYTISENALIIKSPTNLETLRAARMVTDPSDAACYAKITRGNSDYFYATGIHAKMLRSYLENRSRPKKQIKQTLNLIFQEGEPVSLNPQQSSGDMRCRMLSKLLFEGLTRLDEERKPVLSGAKTCTISKEGLLYTFKLRSNRWSNGEKVTANDFVSSLQRALKDRVTHPEQFYILKNARKVSEKKALLKDLGVRALDHETLQIELEWPDPTFLNKLAQPPFFPIYGETREPNCFNGPFLVRKRSHEALLFERNPYFWEATRPFFEQIHIRWLNQIREIYTLYQKNLTDWIGDPISILSSDYIKQLGNEGKLYTQNVNRRFLLCFNTQYHPLASLHIRNALSLSIDRQYICNTIFPNCIPISPSEDFSDAEINALFDRGLEELGLTRETFPELCFIHSHQTGREQVALHLQQKWKEKLGLTTHIENLEWNLFRHQLEKGEFEITATIQDITETSSPDFLERFEGENSWNFSRWKHNEYREMVQEAKHETNQKKREFWLKKAEKILAQEIPFTPLFRYTHHYAHFPGLKGYLIDGEGCVDFSWAYT